MKPLWIDMWWIIKSSTTVSFDKWWRKEVFQRIWTIYVEQKIRIFCHLSKFEFCLLEESLVSLGRLCFTSPTVNKRKRSWNLGLTSFLGIIPHIWQLNFDLLFLDDLIHVFRILELFCNSINIRIEDEPRVRFWMLSCCYCNKKTYSYYMKDFKLPSVVLSNFSFLSLISCEWMFFVNAHSICIWLSSHMLID